MEKYKPNVNNLDQLKQKYDAKTNHGVRGVRKELMLNQNPSIVEEKGKDWEKYLYNTPMDGELESYKKQIEKKLSEAQTNPILDVPQKLHITIPQTRIFNPNTGEFENENKDKTASTSLNKDIFDPSKGEFKGYISNKDKQLAIDAFQKEIEEINFLLEERNRGI